MKSASILAFLALALSLAGCGGMPKPNITAQKAKPGTVNARVALVASNYGSDWDKENVTLFVVQQWRNRDGVPVKEETVAEKAFAKSNAGARGSISLKDAEGSETRRVFLKFELKSGPDPLNQNVSAAITREWNLSSSMAEADLVFLAAISRTGGNNYAIDVVYAQNLATGEIEQVLPAN
ncbi:MAG TPA: hypothetical protein PLF37_03305 [Planctomycetota bacterium]|nr:hypothetical protein [Planctomycetota bacterium]